MRRDRFLKQFNMALTQQMLPAETEPNHPCLITPSIGPNPSVLHRSGSLKTATLTQAFLSAPPGLHNLYPEAAACLALPAVIPLRLFKPRPSAHRFAMPELPEVETTRAGIAPHICGKRFARITVRQAQLRWPVAPDLAAILDGQRLHTVARRAKYLLLHTDGGILLLHLGMSGSLRIHSPGTHPPARKHDHLDFEFDDSTLLRFHDPRRFGAVLWFAGAAEHHPLLQHLGPEPLSDAFDGPYLQHALARRHSAIKPALMDNRVVVGVGNIYANEALFQAGIAPNRPANRLSTDEYRLLAVAVRDVLQRALAAGGSTLRDFVDSQGNSGYFQQYYAVYGRPGQACPRCGGEIVKTVLGQRSSFHCPRCQR